MARIQDELSADRFQTILVDATFADSLSSVIEGLARDPGSDTMLTLFGDPEGGQSELWIIRRSGRRMAIRRAMVATDDVQQMPELLSNRALELLRAVALELSVSPAPPSDMAPPVPDERSDLRQPGPRGPSPAEQGGTFAIDAGIAVSHISPGLSAVVAPLARGRVRLSESIAARLSVSGLGSRPRIESLNGSAEVSQSLGLLELQATFRQGKRARPVVSAGAGVLNARVMGTGRPPYEGKEPHQWSAAFDLGAGVAVGLRPRIALMAEVHAFVAAPHPVVRFLELEAATVGYPGVMLFLGLQVEP